MNVKESDCRAVWYKDPSLYKPSCFPRSSTTWRSHQLCVRVPADLNPCRRVYGLILAILMWVSWYLHMYIQLFQHCFFFIKTVLSPSNCLCTLVENRWTTYAISICIFLLSSEHLLLCCGPVSYAYVPSRYLLSQASLQNICSFWNRVVWIGVSFDSSLYLG